MSARVRVSVFLSLSVLLSIAPSPTVAQQVRQLTDLDNEDFNPLVAIDDTGSGVFVGSSGNHSGMNPEMRREIFRLDAATGAATRLTSLDQGVSPRLDARTVSVSDDGHWIAFIAPADPLGTNHDLSEEVFVISSDGTGLTQLTSDPTVPAGSVWSLAISGNGSRIVFVSNSDLTGANPDHEFQVFAIDRTGANLIQLTHATFGYAEDVSASDDGTRIVFSSDADLTGMNVDRNDEVFAVNSDGSGLRQLTKSTSGSNLDTRISGNGAKIVFRSTNDLVGKNADGSLEIFAINWDGTGLRQVTDSFILIGSDKTPVDSYSPSVTDDGQWVVFSSNQGVYYFGPNSDGGTEVWKIRIDGTGRTALTDLPLTYDECRAPEVSGGGQRVAFVFSGPSYPGVLTNPD